LNIKGKTEAAVDIRVDRKKLNVMCMPSGVAQAARKTGDRLKGFEFLVREETLRRFGLSYKQVIACSKNCFKFTNQHGVITRRF